MEKLDKREYLFNKFNSLGDFVKGAGAVVQNDIEITDTVLENSRRTIEVAEANIHRAGEELMKYLDEKRAEQNADPIEKVAKADEAIELLKNTDSMCEIADIVEGLDADIARIALKKLYYVAKPNL